MQDTPHTCYVLHTRPYRETSLLIEVFSSLHGRVGVIARGARSRRSRQSALLQPLRQLSMGWKGRGELGTLTSAEPEQAAIVLSGQRLFSALYLNELLVRLLHRHEPQPELFLCYQQALSQLATESALQPLLRVFEKHLLDCIGYGLNLEEISLGADGHGDCTYWYQPEAGLVERQPGQQPSVSVAALRALLHEDGFEHEHLRELKLLMRSILDSLLGGRPLHSRALFTGLAGERGTP